MWNLTMKQGYNSLSFNFLSLYKAAEFIDTATATSDGELEFILKRNVCAEDTPEERKEEESKLPSYEEVKRACEAAKNEFYGTPETPMGKTIASIEREMFTRAINRVE